MRPVVWSIAGNDSGGGAGLSADLRAADAFGVHLCPVVAAVTAQNSRGVARIAPVGVEMLDAQLAALEDDMPPAAVKTGVLAHWAQIECVARWIDRLRERAPVALVVDPVLRASTGAAFADGATARAYRELLLPRATVLTPNRAEAAQLLDAAPAIDLQAVPAMGRALQRAGARSVCITGGDDGRLAGQALDWMSTPQASGWLSAPHVATAHSHGTGCSFASATAAALALGFVVADALVLAKMAATQALEHGYAAGFGAGPVCVQHGFATQAHRLPMLSWGEAPDFPGTRRGPRAGAPRPLGLYAIVDSAARVRQVLEAGVRTVQLRIKGTADGAALQAQIRNAVAACHDAGAELFVNDHWALALSLGAPGIHLGQEDLLALDDTQRAMLVDTGVALGISSHSLWELCRAKSLLPRYVACGPVWPTATKAMPWRPQGADNLAWWCAVAPSPVVAIGGVLEPAQVRTAAAAGADGVCVVRAIAGDAAGVVPAFEAAWHEGRAGACAMQAPALPHPSVLSH
jgi:hydroxymethylpyrimidine kinase/phosphomethylpyrimidine kinase/thiamine-phosphate diphosphorylase